MIVASPGDGDTVTAAPVILSGTVTDALSGAVEMICNGQPASLSGADFTCSLPLIEGTNVIDLEAGDAAGNRKVFPHHFIYTPNRPPQADAGADQTITLPAQASLSGTATDDGLPSGSSLATTWSKVSGPGDVMFGDVKALSTTATFSVAGTYILRLTASDGELTGSSDVTITVGQANRPPVADAGTDQEIIVNTHVTLDGSKSTDLDGDALTYQWNLIAKPLESNVFLSNANAVDATFAPDVSGEYIIRLIVNDGKSDSQPDEVYIVVSSLTIYPKIIFSLDVSDYLSYTGFQLNIHKTSPCTEMSFSFSHQRTYEALTRIFQ